MVRVVELEPTRLTAEEPKGDVILVKGCRQQINISSKAALLLFSIRMHIKQCFLDQDIFIYL